MEFNYVTRGNVLPNGKPRVFFCSSRLDFDAYFDEISKDILSVSNCAIYYFDYDKDNLDNPELYDLLDTMQLIVVPVTNDLLYNQDSGIKDRVVKRMLGRKPIIPMMMEDDLLGDFEKLFGNIQFLDKYEKYEKSKGTEIAYIDKLEKRLKEVLVGDELAKRIRSAFDAHIFLSYRKKDRKEAQKLMRLIHSDPKCESIAIWYDEFLIPGTDYNVAIKEAIDNCDVFVFNVTDSFLEEGNYVVTVEFPAAVESEKPIIPVEMRKTDIDKLSKMCDGIQDNLLSIDQQKNVCTVTLDTINSIVNAEHVGDPMHTFFLGLAYLNGIDVEVDEEKGEKLLEIAADGGVPEAMEKLAHIYFDVKREADISKAIMWQKKAVITYKEKLKEDDLDRTLYDSFRDAVEYLRQLYECTADDDGNALCIDAIEEMRSVYAERVLEQPELYKEIFVDIEFLRIQAAGWSNDRTTKEKIVNSVEDDYSKYFKTSPTLENASTLMDIWCEIARITGLKQFSAYNKVNTFKEMFNTEIPDDMLCKMYNKICNIFIQREKISPIPYNVNTIADRSFMENEFGWWKYAEETYNICVNNLHNGSVNNEWNRIYCDCLLVLIKGIGKVVSINVGSSIDPSLVNDFKNYLIELDNLNVMHIINEISYDEKQNYIDSFLEVAIYEYKITFDNEIFEARYKKVLALAKQMIEEDKTRESKVYYWDKLKICADLSLSNDVAKETVEIARELDIHEKTVQSAWRLAKSLVTLFNAGNSFECAKEASSIYEELMHKNLSKSRHYVLERETVRFYGVVNNEAIIRNMENEATEYLNKGLGIILRIYEEYNEIVPELDLFGNSTMVDAVNYPIYTTAYDQFEREIEKIKSQKKQSQLDKLMETQQYNVILREAEGYFSKNKFRDALELYKSIEGKVEGIYRKMFICLKYLKQKDEVLSMYPKVLVELEEDKSTNPSKILFERMNCELEMATIYIEKADTYNAKEHILKANKYFDIIKNEINPQILRNGIEKKIKKMLSQCDDMQ